MKKIFVIVSQFPQTYETFISDELLFLRERGFNFEIFSLKPCRDKVIQPEARKLLNKVRILPSFFSWQAFFSFFYFLLFYPLSLFKTFLLLFRLIFSPLYFLKNIYGFFQALYLSFIIKTRKLKVHLHSHWLTLPSSIGLFCKYLSGVSFSISAHAWDIFFEDKLAPQKIDEAEFVIVCSKFCKDYLLERVGLRFKDKVYLNYHGLNFNILPEVNTKEKLIVSSGRLVKTKGFSTFLKAVSLLKKELADYKILIFGKGPREKELLRSKKKLGLENVVFMGETEREEFLSYLCRAEIFVLASLKGRKDGDGLPNVILEALGLKCAVLASRVSAIPEAVLNQETGLLVEPNQPQELAEKLKLLREDSDLRNRLAERGWQFLKENFSKEKSIEELEKIFKKHLKKKPEVLYLLDSAEFGGAQRVVYDFLRYHNKDRFNFSLAFLRKRDTFSSSLERVLQKDRIFYLNKKKGLDLRVIFRIYALLEKVRPQIVISHLFSPSLWLRIVTLFLPDIRVVVFEHSLDYWKKPYQLRVNRIFSLWTDKIVAVSEEIKDFYVKRVGIKEEKFTVIPSGVDLERFKNLEPSKDLIEEFNLQGYFVLCNVARLSKEKDQACLIQAMRVLILDGLRVKTLIVGEGPLRGELLGLIKDLGLDSCIYLLEGILDIEKVLSVSDVFVLSSLYEGRPLAVLEAMAAGVCVVSSNIPAVQELIKEGHSGLLFEPGDFQTLASEIKRLIKDFRLREYLKENAFKLVRDCNIKESVEKVENLIQNLYNS